MTVNTAKRCVLTILEPTPAVYARQVSWNDAIETFPNFQMKRRVVR